MIIQAVQKSPPAFFPLPISDSVRNVALRCLKELAIALALGAVVGCFIPTQIGLDLLVTALLVQMTTNVLLHSLGAMAKGKGWQRAAMGCEWFAALIFSFCAGLNPQKIVHELGHSLAAIACFTRARPRIELNPFVGGATNFQKSALSAFGKKIGPAATTCLIVASGPGFALGVSAILLMAGLAMREKHPALSKYLIGWALIDFLDHAYYAISALYSEPWGLHHDFVHLSIFGLHPTVAAVGIVAIPVLIWVGKNGPLVKTAQHNREEIRNQSGFEQSTREGIDLQALHQQERT